MITHNGDEPPKEDFICVNADATSSDVVGGDWIEVIRGATKIYVAGTGLK